LRCVTGLRHLHLVHVETTEDLAEVLAGLERLDALRWEGFPGSASPVCVTAAALRTLKPCLTRSRVIGLDCNGLDDRGLSALLDLLPDGTLRELDLARNQLSPTGIGWLAKCEKLRGLRALRL